MLAAHLDENNHKELLTKARGMTKIEVEKLIAISFPKPDCGDVIRKLPIPCPGAGNPVASEAPSPGLPKPRPESIIPLSASRTKFQFSGDDELLAMFRTLRARLSRKYPMGRMEEIIKEAFLVLLEKTDPGRATREKRSSKRTRHVRRIPSSIRREIFRRDGERCTFVSREGVRCDGRHYLEVDHVIPWSLGGSSREASNLTVLCRRHNAWRGGARPVGEKPPACFWQNPRSDAATEQDPPFAHVG
jgi:5-methylcytosine-specific restriction endonuclease McrA